jgi:DNA segregation ATPase FtsK/SpoIIIE, S-DNA-T family
MTSDTTSRDADTGPGGELVPFPDAPAVPAPDTGYEIEPDIIEGEIVDDPPPTGPARVVHAVSVVVQHEHAKRAGRHLGYVPLGAAVVTKRLWDSRTTSRYERMLRMAEASGDLAAVLEVEKRLAEFRRDRHGRRIDMFKVPAELLLLLPKLLLGLFLVLAAFGTLLAIAAGHIAEVAVPFRVAARIAEIVAIVFSITWGPLLLAAPWIAVGALWWTGRGYSGASGWTQAGKQDGEDGGLVVTADTIVLALQNLPIPALRKAFKDGWRPVFHMLPVKDGRGYSAVYSLPLGVTATMVADQRPVFARNLHRAEIEAWPSDAEKAGTGPAGTGAVWIADPGVLSKPAPEYPLLHEGTADVFKGVPGGVSPRGDELMIPVVGNNFVVGGQMGQGKSNACRVFMLGCALDPLAELDVFVFANNGDFDAYQPRLARYVKGVEDDTIAAAVSRLQELYEEVARREGRLAELGAKKVTRQLAQQHRDMRPVVVLFSECHELFGHPEHGAIAAELATKIIKRARKTGITLLFDTQSSRKEAIPPKLVELVSVNACFYVKTWRSNDGFLGDGSFAAGIRATELRPGRDRGTSLITGVSEAQFELLRWYFIEVDDDAGTDAAADVIARAVDRVASGTPVGASVALAAIEVRDLLEDLDDVLGDERVKLRDAVGLLRSLAPTWTAYRSMTARQLAADLAADDVRTVNSSGTPYLDPTDLRRAIAEREIGDE